MSNGKFSKDLPLLTNNKKMNTHKKRLEQLEQDWEDNLLEYNEYVIIKEWLIQHQ